MLLSETWSQIIGAGTCNIFFVSVVMSNTVLLFASGTTLSKAVIGLVTKMLSSICVKKRLLLLLRYYVYSRSFLSFRPGWLCVNSTEPQIIQLSASVLYICLVDGVVTNPLFISVRELWHAFFAY